MNWTEPKPPTEGISYYDHITSETPLGRVKIEWKSWDKNDSYDVEIDGLRIFAEYSLEAAKNVAKEYYINVT